MIIEVGIKQEKDDESADFFAFLYLSEFLIRLGSLGFDDPTISQTGAFEKRNVEVSCSVHKKLEDL